MKLLIEIMIIYTVLVIFAFLIFFSTEAINIAINPNVHGVEMQNRPSFTIHVNAN